MFALARDFGLARTILPVFHGTRMEKFSPSQRNYCSPICAKVRLGYSSQTAFAAAFRKLTGETPSGWRRRMR